MNVNELKRMVALIKEVTFPDALGTSSIEEKKAAIEGIVAGQTGSTELAGRFMAQLPEIIGLLHTDVEAVAANDPAVTSQDEIILCYPAIKVMANYRVAHALLQMGVSLIPRVLTELAHSETGVDIHPAAQIGEHFAIDHGTGIVIGETSIIGKNVMLYQGVTLGAKNFHYDHSGRPLNEPRHPVLEDNVTVYSNTSILGRVRIGHDTVIGGNVWLTHDVPPYSKVIQGKTITETLFEGGSGI